MDLKEARGVLAWLEQHPNWLIGLDELDRYSREKPPSEPGILEIPGALRAALAEVDRLTEKP
jgi:hypothetical protein